MLETLHNLFASIGDTHSIATQISVAIVVTVGLLLCVLSVFVPLRPIIQDEPETWGDRPLASPEPERQALGTGGGDHVAGSPNSIVVRPE